MMEDKTRKLLKFLAVFSLTIIIVMTVYGVVAAVVSGVEVFGLTFVNTEIPPIEWFPYFYMKPITWLVFAILLFVFSTVELYEAKLAAIAPFYKTLVRAGTFVVGGLSLYEVLWNFMFWSGMVAVGRGELHPDLVINPFPNPEIPWSVVFASKLYVASTIVCAYLFYVVSKSHAEQHPSL